MIDAMIRSEVLAFADGTLRALRRAKMSVCKCSESGCMAWAFCLLRRKIEKSTFQSFFLQILSNLLRQDTASPQRQKKKKRAFYCIITPFIHKPLE